MKLAEINAAIAEIAGAHFDAVGLKELASAIGEADEGGTKVFSATDAGMYVGTYSAGTVAEKRRPRLEGTLTPWRAVSGPRLVFAGYGGKLDMIVFSLATPYIHEADHTPANPMHRALADLAAVCNLRAHSWMPIDAKDLDRSSV